MCCDTPFLFSGLFLMAALLSDIKWRRIPNWITVPMLLGGIWYHVFHVGTVQGLYFAMEGFIVGFCLLLLPFLLGGMGGGDVKLFAALGSWFGAQDIFQLFIYSALFGGCISIGIMLYRREWAGVQSVWGDLRCMIYKGLMPEGKSGRITFSYSIPTTMGFFLFGLVGRG